MRGENRALAAKRLFNEYRSLVNSPVPGIIAGPITEDDIFRWEACFTGPEDTPYEGGAFTAELHFPPTYPFEAPKMTFTCPMWHPNGGSMISPSLPSPGPAPSLLYSPLNYEGAAELSCPTTDFPFSLFLFEMSFKERPPPFC